MEIIYDLLAFWAEPQGCALAIGIFDGVHLGHRKILSTARKIAQDEGLEFVVFSFSPGPYEYFRGTDEGYYLLTLDEFTSRLADQGVDRLLLIPFDTALSEHRADDFLHSIIKDKLNTKALVVGDDFRFGVGREGNIDFIKAHSEEIGLKLIVLDELNMDGMRVRSTTIRDMIRAGKITDANRMLGYEYSVCGTVVPGFGVGKKIGCPTLNIELPRCKVKPLRGVYATRAEIEGKTYPAVSNYGVRPTFGDNEKEAFETHLIGIEDIDFLSKKIKVSFVEFIRAEIKFASLDELALQIKQDISKASGLLGLFKTNKQD